LLASNVVEPAALAKVVNFLYPFHLTSVHCTHGASTRKIIFRRNYITGRSNSGPIPTRQ